MVTPPLPAPTSPHPPTQAPRVALAEPPPPGIVIPHQVCIVAPSGNNGKVGRVRRVPGRARRWSTDVKVVHPLFGPHVPLRTAAVGAARRRMRKSRRKSRKRSRVDRYKTRRVGVKKIWWGGKCSHFPTSQLVEGAPGERIRAGMAVAVYGQRTTHILTRR